MTLILSGTNGLSDVDGSAATPAIRGTDTNTGMFFPAADTIGFAEGGAEVARFDSSGTLLAGLTSSTGTSPMRMQVKGAAGGANPLAGYSLISAFDEVSGHIAIASSSENSINISVDPQNLRASSSLQFSVDGSERARIDSSGYFKASNNGTYTYTASMHEFRQNAADYVLTLTNSNASPTGLQVYQITDANGTGNNFVDCYAGNTYRFQVRSNGGIANYSGNNVNLSDRREKANFAPAKSYLDTICAIPVQTFNYIDQSEDDPGLTLGVVAQDVQAVAPELVMESNWGTAEDPKMRLSIYQTDLQYALMKCIQELKAQNDELRQRVAALESGAK